MVTNNPLFDYVIEHVDSPKWNPNSKYLDCKCPYCDETTSKKHGHFHIYLNEGSPMYYNCFRASCGRKGVLNRKVAMDLGLDDPVFLKLIQKTYDSNVIVDSTKKFRYKGLHDIVLGDIIDDAAEYFKKRTGHVLTEELQKKFRICCSINKFVENNKDQPKLDIDALKYLRYKENVLGNKYIYFFNETYTMLFGRQINGDEKVKLSIINSTNPLLRHSNYWFEGDGRESYNDRDVENTLFLAEGVFDIINAYFHIYKEYRGIFMASTSFTSTSHIINNVSKLVYKPDIVILSDSDVDIKVYTRFIYKRLNKKRLGDMYVVYNTEDKDLGDYKGKPYKLEIIKIHTEGG